MIVDVDKDWFIRVAMPRTGNLFIMMAGLPGSGKSTLVKRLVNTRPFHVASTDDFLQKIADENGLTYDDVWGRSNMEVAEGNMWSKAAAAFTTGVDVIWDQTNLGPRKRKNVLKAVPDSYHKICVVTECAEDDRQARLAERVGKTIPTHVDAQMLQTWLRNKPTAREGFNAVIKGVDF